MKLSLYNKKRNFKKTPEPKGKHSRQYKNLFVIQKHAASHLHYDFRLELNGVLLSWAIPKGPSLDPAIKRLAIHVEDHPVNYGNFEGIIPHGEYGGGIVMLWDKGKWISEDDDPVAAYHKGHLRFHLRAKKLKGRWSLVRLRKNDNKSWFLVKGKDEYAKPENQYDITREEPNSVISHYDLDEIAHNYQYIWDKHRLVRVDKKKKSAAKKNKIPLIKLPTSAFPKVIFPELATLIDKPPNGKEWLHEIKLDGYRILAFKKGKTVKLMSRNNHEWTHHFLNIFKAIKNIPVEEIILDGEIVLLDKNEHSNFQLLQNALHAKENSPFIYYVFDILYYEKHNLMQLPLLERKELLHQLLLKENNPVLRYSDHIRGKGRELFKKMCEIRLEGIVSKNIHSKYEEKRSQSWVKIKCINQQEFIIGGYSPPQGARDYFGSLYLGYFDKKGNLKFCGNVGTGFDRASLKNIYNQLQKLVTRINPFSMRPAGYHSAIWIKPKLVAEIEFAEWTEDGMLRQASFKGLRQDKPAESIIKEKEMPIKKVKSLKKLKLITEKTALPFKLTNPNKILYSEGKITKLDIALYYDQIQEWILPYLINRPLTLVRCPDSYKKCFYQKHGNKAKIAGVYESTEKLLYIEDQIGLMSLVQMGTLEIHPWGSQINNLEFPEMITFDIDPAPGISWSKVVLAAKRIREHLASFKLKSFVKSTGGKGLHVVIPIKPEYDWELVKKFSHVFVQFLVANYPKEYVGETSKEKRKGKIFIDYLRNQRGATAISVYSTRARQDAPVAVPLAWDELTNKIKDTSYTIHTLPSRLNELTKDPWQDFFKIKQSLRLDKI